MKRTVFIVAMLAATGAWAQSTPSTVTPTALPANVQADLATVQADMATLHTAMQTLRTDEQANAPTVAADRSAVGLARLQLRMDMGKLHIDAAPILQADATALQVALTQLHNDQVANNASALAADQAAVKSAGQLLHADMKQLHMGMGHGRHWHGGPMGGGA
ncbi:MAG TPA: hypothetical protein VMG61_13285 [Usitatibacter sp.]|nr:hypothetical protein [Usitatibacter sp.]